MRTDFFHRLPPPMAAFVLAALLDVTAAHVIQPLPRHTQPPTTTVPHHAISAVSWPLLLPTAAPLDPLDLRRRQDTNTICGFLGGISALPATCSAGSHCVLDTQHSAVGCCPNGQETCTAGVFTGCVDANSGPQTEVNPYVFTCLGSDVCYKNVFDGGFSQFGCGTASDLATTVLATASGITQVLVRPTLSVPFTDTVSTLSTPTTLGTVASSFSTTTRPLTSSSITAARSSPATTNQSSSTSSSSSTATTKTADPTAAPAAATSADRTGVIVGGTISGVAVLVAVIAVAVFFMRRRGSNVRSGPGSNSPAIGKYISPPRPGPSTGFMAVAAQDSDAFETGGGNASAMLPPMATTPAFSSEITAGGPSPFAYAGAAGVLSPSAGARATPGPPPLQPIVTSPSIYAAYPSYPPQDDPNRYHYPGQYPAAYAGAGSGRVEPDQVPLTREIDDFSQGFQVALGRIGEEDEDRLVQGTGNGGGRGGLDDLAVNEGNGVNGPPPAAAGTGATAAAGATGDNASTSDASYRGSVRPLWQQNRRQSRNLMWM
ncbi:hypothetical protein B0T24DRAFT_139085 [Lasiosphaeria ovina]|uniref:Mid2 domain-containing protein n=1 Tax=Lasiosphaeria ovina TaxID=92902 RepID=A0AAE0KM78_9PEZI|nr:hypothetical protein B0T24DRAFT_139085 [Lasiosphaeria ovina]